MLFRSQNSQNQLLGTKTRKSLFPEFSPGFFNELMSPETNFSGRIPSAVRISRQVRQVYADSDQSRPILDDDAQISQNLIGQQVRPGPTDPVEPRQGPAEPAQPSTSSPEDPVSPGLTPEDPVSPRLTQIGRAHV